MPETTLLNPNEGPALREAPDTSPPSCTPKPESIGLYFVDTMKLGRLFELSGGVRWDRFNTGYNLYQPTPPPPVEP